MKIDAFTDTTNSRYVNLEEVAQILQQGNDVQVIDAATGDDITRLILTQIIVEDAKLPIQISRSIYSGKWLWLPGALRRKAP